jgi:hypothetical protein
VTTLNTALNQTEIFNRLTNNGTIQGIYMQNGQLYINASYIQSGTLKLGGVDNTNGVLEVYDANGNLIGTFDKDGLSATGNLVMKNENMVVAAGILEYGLTNRSTARGFAVTYVHPNTGDYLTQYGIFPTFSNLNHQILSNLAERVYATSTWSKSISITPQSGSSHSMSMSFGTDDAWTLRIAGISTYTLYVSNSSFLYKNTPVALQSSSSHRYKHSIRPIESADLDPHKLLFLPIVQFEWNDDHPLQYEDMKGQTIPGIIAEDVEEIYPAATIHDMEGHVESWDERRLIPGMLALIQEQDKKIKQLEARLAKIEEMLK